MIKDLHNITKTYNIFLLKIDTEGYDMNVLEGSRNLLKDKRIKFIIFEYNQKWFSNERNKTLQYISNFMFDMEYECYFISIKGLIPLWREFFHKEYEIREWSNCFCGIKSDHHLRYIIRNYDEKNIKPTLSTELNDFIN